MRMTKKQLIEAKIKAKELYLQNKHNQKEIAKMVGVSENSMSRWVGKYHWNQHMEREFYESDNCLFSFLRYLKMEKTDMYESVQASFKCFVDRNTKKHDAAKNVL